MRAITRTELDELVRRFGAAHDQEEIIAYMLTGESTLAAGGDDIFTRIAALADTYQRAIIFLVRVAAKSPVGDSSLVDRNSRL